MPGRYEEETFGNQYNRGPAFPGADAPERDIGILRSIILTIMAGITFQQVELFQGDLQNLFALDLDHQIFFDIDLDHNIPGKPAQSLQLLPSFRTEMNIAGAKQAEMVFDSPRGHNTQHFHTPPFRKSRHAMRRNRCIGG